MCGCKDIYAEINNIDILGINGIYSFAIEMKTSLSIKVLEQAYERTFYCDYVYICIPKKTHNKNRVEKHMPFPISHFLKSFGIGLIEVLPNASLINEYHKGCMSYNEIYSAKLNRVAKKSRAYLKKSLFDEAKNNIGGSNNKDVIITPYGAMINEIKNYLKTKYDYDKKEYIYVSLEDIIKDCQWTLKYYGKNPRPSLYQTLKQGWNYDYFENEIINKRIHFRYKENNK